MVEVIHSMSLVGQQRGRSVLTKEGSEADSHTTRKQMLILVLHFSEDGSSTFCASRPGKVQLSRQLTYTSGAVVHILFLLVKVHWFFVSCSPLFFRTCGRF